jgi:hypothetical protein
MTGPKISTNSSHGVVGAVAYQLVVERDTVADASVMDVDDTGIGADAHQA